MIIAHGVIEGDCFNIVAWMVSCYFFSKIWKLVVAVIVKGRTRSANNTTDSDTGIDCESEVNIDETWTADFMLLIVIRNNC